MKLEIINSELQKLLLAVKPAVATRSTFPLISCINIQVDGNEQGKFIATNLDVWLEVGFEASNNTPFYAILPYKELANITKGWDKKAIVTFEINEEANQYGVCTISCGSMSFKLGSLPQEEWPLKPLSKGEWATKEMIDTSATLFFDALATVSVASARDDTRPILQGVCFENVDKHLSLVATDGFRIHRQLAGHITNFNPGNIIVDATPLKTAGIVWAKTDKKADISLSIHHEIGGKLSFLVIENHNFEFIIRCTDGQYPDYTPIIPKSVGKLTVNRKELLTVVKSMDKEIVVLENKGNKGILKVSDKDGVTATLESATNGIDFCMAVNTWYLIDLLNTAKGDTIAIQYGPYHVENKVVTKKVDNRDVEVEERYGSNISEPLMVMENNNLWVVMPMMLKVPVTGYVADGVDV